MRYVSIKLNGMLAVLLDTCRYPFAVFHNLIYTIFRQSFKVIQGQGHFHDSRPLQRGFTIP